MKNNNNLRLALLTVLLLTLTTRLFAAAAGSLRGKVVGPDNRPMAGVLVVLRNDVTGVRQQAASGEDGQFSFFNGPFNPYELHIDVQGFASVRRDVDIHSAVPVDTTVTLAVAQLSEKITVAAEQSAAQLETDSTQSHIDIDKSYIAKAPAAVSSRAMEQIVTSTPGFAKDENGRFHFQGAHSQGEYVVDGQTIGDQTGITFSNSIDPGIAQGIEIIYGNVPAEFGEKIGAVINLTTKSGLGLGKAKTEVFVGGSKFSTFEAGASVGGGTQTFGYFGSVNGSKSDRFLDPVNFDNLHNHGSTFRGFLRLDSQSADQKSSFRLTTLVGQTRRDVPNTFTQQAAGQDERVSTQDENLNLGWQNVLSSTSVFEIIGYSRFAKFKLTPSVNDTPVIVTSDRTLNNYGITPSFSWTNATNEVKVGATIKRYPIKELFSFGITDPGLNDPTMEGYNPNLAPYALTRGGSPFVFNGRRNGSYYAGYAQDNIKVSHLTPDLRVRHEPNSPPVVDSAFEPRLGAAYYIPSSRTVFRVSYHRVIYTPEFENILFSSSLEAARLVPPEVQASNALGGGELFVHSERQNVFDAGIQQAVGSKIRLDADYWRRRSRFAGDQGQFENTGIVFPVAFAHGRLDGWNVRADLARTAGLRGFLSLGHTHAEYVPPLAGGLFLDTAALDTISQGAFLIVHDHNLHAQLALPDNHGET